MLITPSRGVASTAAGSLQLKPYTTNRSNRYPTRASASPTALPGSRKSIPGGNASTIRPIEAATWASTALFGFIERQYTYATGTCPAATHVACRTANSSTPNVASATRAGPVTFATVAEQPSRATALLGD